MNRPGLMFFLLGGCSLLLSGCSTLAGVSPEAGNIMLNIKTDQAAYAHGEIVRITMTVKNYSTERVILEFSTSRQYDFMIYRDNQEIWTWSRNKYFTQAFTRITLEPGDSITYNVEWNQQDNEGRAVGPGLYSIRGILPAIGQNISASITIAIK